jgi:hypothetical protein
MLYLLRSSTAYGLGLTIIPIERASTLLIARGHKALPNTIKILKANKTIPALKTRLSVVNRYDRRSSFIP